MTIRVALHHHTRYRYDRLVRLAPHLVRLRPAPHTRTPVHRYSLSVEPAEHFVNWQQDAFSNHVARYVFPEPTRELAITVDLVVDLVTINPFDFFIEEQAEEIPFSYETQQRKELAPYFEIRESGTALLNWLKPWRARQGERTVEFLVAINQALQETVGYVIRMEPGIQSCETTLTRRLGSCRDSAWLLVQILRHLGLAARFVSGYLVQLTPDVPSLDGPSGPTEDFTDLHAWTEVFLPGAGWVGLDPTSGLFAGEGHIPLACTPDPQSASPVTGAVDEAEVSFEFENRVTRIHEDPRVTKPYSDDDWVGIQRLGARVDDRLAAGDVRLTMGGEPTFVGIDHLDDPEWNTAALGEHKRERAEVLLRRLWDRFAPYGVLHHGQGKWYPGEPLPRWALSCVWRQDGVPIWRERGLLADPTRPAGLNEDDAQRFVTALAEALGVGAERAVPGFEDGLYYAWKEGQLPANLDTADNRLDDALERERLRRVFDQGLGKTVGYALPLAWDSEAGAWISHPWEFRRGRMFLLPGDSPMGLRLPLDALLWEAESARRQQLPADPFAAKPPLPQDPAARYARYRTAVPASAAALAATAAPVGAAATASLTADRRGAGAADKITGATGRDAAAGSASAAADGDRRVTPAGGLVRTALCVEPRGGTLFVFLPPFEDPGPWLELIAALESVASALRLPIALEGYEPPHDDRLQRFQVTPDPGVIEVNIHPATNWAALQRQTELLYEEARLSRLTTEKFMHDGRHTGTGGGNHVTLGGATPGDSPLLRRPQLLASLLCYWQNHPGLSYLFSGTFIGPTSQAPRVDEARDDSLYELEIALAQITPGDSPAPWRVDRILRNLLVDITGNTHRAEFCIDKLYSPDSPVGRRGLLEFRGFEMPPHARMSLVQMLLLRTLVARFWEHPYEQAPVRWGTELHDRFLLPHYVERDLRDVVADLQRWGFDFQPHWLDPFVEFRFPHYGSVNIDDVELELRFAIEPWNVLGEEVTGQGTARFVDSSVERLQVKVQGLTEGRHLVTCNGRRLPLRRTGRRSEFVAGVRYKAWNPPSGLHPTLPVNSPLVFDLVDTWNQRSLGGCTYHVSHPSGRNPETQPVNAYEAESRRLARFTTSGHTPGPLDPPREQPQGDHPYTLDLRHPGC